MSYTPERISRAMSAFRQLLEQVDPGGPVRVAVNTVPEPGFVVQLSDPDQIEAARNVFPDRVQGVPVYAKILGRPWRLHAEERGSEAE